MQQSATALVIDNEKIARHVTFKRLQKLGFETFEACDGREGLWLLQQRAYSICFCDYEMPVMDGFECVSHLREWEATNRPHWRQPVIGVSSHKLTSEEILLSAGVNCTMKKPYSLSEMKVVCATSASRSAQGQVSQTPVRPAPEHSKLFSYHLCIISTR